MNYLVGTSVEERERTLEKVTLHGGEPTARKHQNCEFSERNLRHQEAYDETFRPIGN
jgi:hypothetical protein